MRRLGVFLLASLLALTTAVAAGASVDCDARPDHQQCNGDADPDGGDAYPTCQAEFAVRVAGLTRVDCEWTPTEMPVTAGIVSVATTSGALRTLTIFVRDSAPGNICVLEESQPLATFPLVSDDKTYWENPTNWCRQFEDNPRTDLNGEALHVTLIMRGKPGTQVEVSLSP